MSTTLTCSFVLRTYGDTLVLASAPEPLGATIAASSRAEARDALREAVATHLEHLHPRHLARPSVDVPTDAHRVTLPLYRDRSAPGGGDSPLDTAIRETVSIVVERYDDGWVRLWSPSTSEPIWTRQRDAPPGDPLSRWPRLEAALRSRRATDTDLARHRPRSNSIEYGTLEVSVEPLDLCNVESDSLDRERFASDELVSSDRSSRSSLAALARRYRRTEEVAGPSPTLGRTDLLRELESLLGTAPPTPVALVGPPRVGKTALVRQFAESLAESDEPGAPRLWSTGAARLRAAAGDDREEGARLETALRQLESTGDVLHLAELAGSGGREREPEPWMRSLRGALAERDVRLVAEATLETWQRLDARHPEFADAFEVVRLEAHAESTGGRIVRRAGRDVAEALDVEVDDEALERLWSLHRRFATRASPVGEALDFLKRLLRQRQLDPEPRVGETEVVERFCDETGLSRALVRMDRSVELDELQDALSTRVLGQREAVQRVVDAVGVARAELGARDRPFGAFVFVGPTGVGKTELARALAAQLFGDDERLVRLDMSEYNQPGAYRRLIGEHGGEAALTDPVRRSPFSIVLLDEIEKAHEEVFDLLLQVLGEARLTDAEGRTARFHNTILIMTSNLGSRRTTSASNASSDPEDPAVFRDAVETFFRPEFVGRLDRIVPFHTLSHETLRAIARRCVDDIGARRGVERARLALEVDDALLDRIAERGAARRGGARPVRQLVDERLAAALARRLSVANLASDRAYRAHAAPDGDGGVRWTIQRREVDEEGEETTADGGGDDELLELLEEATELRRRIRDYMGSERFAELERELEAHDRESQADDFWQRDDAAEAAQRAETLREFVESAEATAGELEAIEELAREAFHDQSDELTGDIRDQIETHRPRVQRVFLELLRTSIEQPNEVVLFLPADTAEDPWRNQLAQWYAALADRRDWRCQFWQAIPPGERDRAIGMDEAFERREVWRTQRRPHGRVVAVQCRGPAVRAFLRGEEGRHRLVTDKEAETIEVHLLEANEAWPHPEAIRYRDPLRQTVRVWDRADGRVRIPEGPEVEFDAEAPWEELIEHLEASARRLLDGREQ